LTTSVRRTLSLILFLLVKFSSFGGGRHLWRPGMLKIDPGYEKGLQIAVALADRDHIFYHSVPFLA
jgi:hypothetical protein